MFASDYAVVVMCIILHVYASICMDALSVTVTYNVEICVEKCGVL